MAIDINLLGFRSAAAVMTKLFRIAMELSTTS